MHSRCCWPPESAIPGWLSRSRTSSHRPPRSRHSLTRASRLATFSPLSRRPASTFWAMDIEGNGLGFWNTIPMRSRVSVTRSAGP